MSLVIGGVKVDATGESLSQDAEGSVRLDGMMVCRRVVHEGQVFLQFKDYDRMRSQCRGTRLIEIPLEVFSAILGDRYE